MYIYIFICLYVYIHTYIHVYIIIYISCTSSSSLPAPVVYKYSMLCDVFCVFVYVYVCMYVSLRPGSYSTSPSMLHRYWMVLNLCFHNRNHNGEFCLW